MQFGNVLLVWLGVGALAACGALADVDEHLDLDLEDAAAGDVAPAARRELAQRAYVKASNTDAYDFFGHGIALSADGSTLAVGAWGERSAAAGVGGDQADNSTDCAGAVYVYRRHGKQWIQQAYLKASHPDAYDGFGGSVALSADGSTLAVGADREDSAAGGVGGDQTDNSIENAGAVYVFTRHGNTWAQAAYLKAAIPGELDYFGSHVALSADGALLAVSAWGEDSAATGIGGDQADDSAPYAGAVYVFARSGATWRQAAYVKASNTDAGDQFGESIALSADGATLAIGALGERSAATGIGGDQADDSAPYAGAAYVFTRSGATWRQEAYVKASNTGWFDIFGQHVALSGDGSTLAVGAVSERSAATGINGDQADDSAYNAGAVYVFARGGASWRQQAYVKASNTDVGDAFGAAVALSRDGSTLAVGAIGEASAATGVGGDQADDSVPEAGAVYVFARSGAAWRQDAYAKASNPGEGDFFGWGVALSRDASILIASAGYEQSAATGIDGDQANDAAPYSGAVYVFDRWPGRAPAPRD